MISPWLVDLVLGLGCVFLTVFDVLFVWVVYGVFSDLLIGLTWLAGGFVIWEFVGVSNLLGVFGFVWFVLWFCDFVGFGTLVMW